MKSSKNFLAIDPGLREMGIAQFWDGELIDYAVKSVRRPGNRKIRLEMFKTIIARVFNKKKPQLIVFEKICFANIPQNQQLMKAIDIIRNSCSKRRITVCEIAPNIIKKAVADDVHATKRALAKAVCKLYPELKVLLDMKRRWRERYYQNLFDAVACGTAYLKSHKHGKD